MAELLAEWLQPAGCGALVDEPDGPARSMVITLPGDSGSDRAALAIDIATGGTRHKEKLFRPDQLDGVYTLRRGLSQMPHQAGMEWLIKRIANTPNNDQLLCGASTVGIGGSLVAADHESQLPRPAVSPRTTGRPPPGARPLLL